MRWFLLRIPPQAAAMACVFLAIAAAGVYVGVAGEDASPVVAVAIFVGSVLATIVGACVSFYQFCVAADLADVIVRLPADAQPPAIKAIQAIDAGLGERVDRALAEAGIRLRAVRAKEKALRDLPEAVADVLRSRGVLPEPPVEIPDDPNAALDAELSRRKKLKERRECKG